VKTLAKVSKIKVETKQSSATSYTQYFSAMGLFSKPFYCCNCCHIAVVRHFNPGLIFADKARVKSNKVLHSGRLQPCLQILNEEWSEWARQTLQLITKWQQLVPLKIL
jgi:hypothetical protein